MDRPEAEIRLPPFPPPECGVLRRLLLVLDLVQMGVEPVSLQ
jgi:hypothetical protein